jgi:hypothetical protein
MSTDRILALIDEEVARLKQVRQLLTGANAASSSDTKAATLGRKRRHLSAAARKKIADAQRLRWAEQKKAS